MSYKLDDLDRWAEKVRACLAEVGFVDGQNVHFRISEERGIDVCYTTPNRPPTNVLWRARELSEVDVPICLSHFAEYERSGDYNGCQADRRLMQDCATR